MGLLLTEDLLEFDGFDAGGGEMYKYNGQPFTGIIVEYYSNGNVAAEEEFVNGYRNGVQRRYFQNNQKQEEFNIKFNRIEGTFKIWDSSGNLKSESIWKDGDCIQVIL
mgnify:CR=1 FL=1|jgi:antitoxin component YwqK of YwqJK toxin-antitoxin module